ncbi:MAG TPA: DUF4134 domain-containing protein [Puia sp.]|jgi:hypothetical protein
MKRGGVRIVLVVLTVSALVTGLSVWAQDGNAGINQANTMVRSYFDTGVNLLYAVGAIVGLIGAVKVYRAWSNGDHETSKLAASWFGACIFLVVVATVIRSFFGL